MAANDHPMPFTSTLGLHGGRPCQWAGWLHKLGHERRIFQKWNRRYFVLNGQTLSYYRGASTGKPASAKRTIDLAGCAVFPCEQSHGKKRENCFVIKGARTRPFFLEASSLEDMMTWLDFLKTASEIGCRPKSVGFSWTVCVPTCPVKFHCVDFKWVDTSFPLGLDFEMKQGGSIVVKNVYGEARAQNADILKGEVILALNGTCVKGWSMEKFVEAVRAAAPGSNAHCQNGCDPTRTKLSAKPSKQASVNISFTFARKDTSNPMRSKVRKGL